MNSYHFDFGNSSEGPVGYSARVFAETPEEAVDRLKQLMPLSSNPIHGSTNSQIEYVQVYFNPDAITIDDITEVNEAKDA